MGVNEASGLEETTIFADTSSLTRQNNAISFPSATDCCSLQWRAGWVIKTSRRAYDIWDGSLDLEERFRERFGTGRARARGEGSRIYIFRLF